MTPDKIYLNTPKIQPELDNTTWDTKTYANCENIEYIRKDALLEWATEQKEKLGSSDSFTTQGKRKMLERLIDKIESL